MKTSAALLGLVAAACAQSGLNDGSVQPEALVKQAGASIQQVPGGNLPSGPEAVLQVYNKYHKQAPASVQQAAAVAKTQSGTVKATNEPYDQAYLAPVNVGGKVFQLDFDTGSSDLWVFSTGLPKNERNGHTLYGDTGTEDKGETWAISYGDGSGASGNVFADKVSVGKVTATVQAVEAATSVSSRFVSGASDGLLGLGFDAGNECSPDQCYTFMHQVGSTLPQDLFTATLKKGAPGTYDFGYIDHSKYTGTIAYSNINHSGTGNPTYWEFVAGGYSIGSGARIARSMVSIADTGTSLAYLDDVVVNAFYAKVKGAENSASAGGWIFPCSSTLPNFSIYSGGAKHTVPGNYANYAPVSSPSGYCFGGVQSNSGIGFSILGDVFLKSQFVVFDRSVPRVGFAQQA